jgi:phospholipid-binding lipoprotein MlaA
MAPTLAPHALLRAPSALALALGLALALPSQAQQAEVGASRDVAPVGSTSADAIGAESADDGDPALAETAEATSASAEPSDGRSFEPPVSTEANTVQALPEEITPADATDADAPASDAPSANAQSAADEPVATGEPTAPTAAEDDFEALYGEAAGDATVARPAAYDPWERYNRKMHRFNNAVDRRVARPLAKAYVRAVPTPVRAGVSNFFSNLGQPVSAVNALLQGKPKQAAHSLGRFVLNSTLGIGGVFDPASAAKLENRSEDFGQTLGVWGWRRSRYVELPLFGPRTLRDVLGMAGDAPLSPLRQVDADKIRVPLQGMQLVDLRAQLLSTDALREGVEDDYILVRDAWSQRRDYQMMGDRETKDEDPTVVPVDAMPVPINN